MMGYRSCMVNDCCYPASVLTMCRFHYASRDRLYSQAVTQASQEFRDPQGGSKLSPSAAEHLADELGRKPYETREAWHARLQERMKR